MIEVRELTKRYGNVTAVDRLSFDVKPGIVTGFLGPNGAGKSTTMRMILGLDRPTSGSVRLDGKEYGSLAAPMREVGALLDAKAVQGGRSARQHLRWVAQASRIPERRVGEVLDIVGVSEVAGRKAGTFSLGMSQRLGIACALLGDPRILLFDEPVNGLDPEGIRWIRTLLKRLAAEGRTVFVSSHLMTEMEETADHVIVIGRGRVVADIDVETLRQQVSGAQVRVVSPQAGELAPLLQRAGASITHGEGAIVVRGLDAARISDIAADHRIRLHELAPYRVSLEAAFMELTHNTLEYSALVREEARS
ncbi:ABC transporter ATP-binding protein [bacterium]|nr:ABC transporter ATP-binding protein [bacterium]